MFFVIPEIPSKTFVMLKKNFLITLRFKVTEQNLGTEAVLEAENVTMAVMNQCGCFKLHNAHNQ